MYSQSNKKRAFISFDFDNDQFLRDSLVGQSKNPDSPFEITNWSVKEPFPQSTWEQDVNSRIKQCAIFIVMVGEKTYSCQGVLKEIQMAIQANVPYFGLHGYRSKNCPVPSGLDKTYDWTWENVKLLIDGNR
jgi:hypothetical protein